MAKTAGKQGKGGKPAAKVQIPAAPERTEILVVGTKVKDVVRNAGCMSSAELLEAVSLKVHDILLAAAERAKQNGRSTVRPYDL